MKIVICMSINCSEQAKPIIDELQERGHQLEIPFYTKKILNGEMSLEDFVKAKDKSGDLEFREKAGQDLIKRHYNNIKEADAILVLNYEKKGVPDYIGGNTFLEMGFAHVLEKKIFLLNPIPEVGYKDELVAMQPVILNGDLNKI